MILFFKTNAKGHFRRLSSGKTVWVKGHQDKRLEHHDSQRQAEDVLSPTDHGASAHLPKEGAAHEQVGPNLSIDGLMSFVKPEHRPPQGGA